jgi:hypothetical protein
MTQISVVASSPSVHVSLGGDQTLVLGATREEIEGKKRRRKEEEGERRKKEEEGERRKKEEEGGGRRNELTKSP